MSLEEQKLKLTQIEHQIRELERGGGGSNSQTVIDASAVAAELEDLRIRLNSLFTESHRDDYKRRVQHLKSLYEHAKSGLDKYISKKNKKATPYLDQRDQLLHGSANPAMNPNLDIEQAEASSLSRSNRMVNDYIASGQESLAELVNQGGRLKGVERKVLDIMVYLGLSDSIMKSVNRRDAADKLIVYGGMIFILALIFIIYKYFH